MSNPLNHPDQEWAPEPDEDAPPPYQPTGEMPEPSFPDNPPQPTEENMAEAAPDKKDKDKAKK